MDITFLGAAQTVTGSCYLIKDGNTKFLVDFGMFQGPEVYDLNYRELEFNPSELDFVLLTHAHIDHSGLLPILAKYGFKGKVYMTAPTMAITTELLIDSARIQEYNSRKEHSSKKALYRMEDAQGIISKFEEVEFGEIFSVGGVKIEFIIAGHILGAASIYIETHTKRILFSGDIGRNDQSLIPTFDTKRLSQLDPDYIVMESLYGGQSHPSRQEAYQKMFSIVNETLIRNGSVVIPCFALHRTQEFIEIFDLAINGGLISDNVQIFVDGKLGNKITDLYRRFSEFMDNSRVNSYSYLGSAKHEDLGKYDGDNIKFSRSKKQVLKFRYGNKNAVFIAGSGMADGGTVLGYLRKYLPGDQNSIVFVGYQAEGTRGRDLVEGAKTILIDEQGIEVNASVSLISGFSAHADNQDLLDWYRAACSRGVTKNVFLTHADIERSESFSSSLGREDDIEVVIPELLQNYVL